MNGVARTALLVMVGCCALGGCFGSLFKSKVPPPVVYQLAPLAPLAPAAPAASSPAGSAASPEASATSTAGAASQGVAEGQGSAVSLVVLRPHVRTGLDGDLILLLYSDRHLDYLAGARWSGPVDDLVQDLAVQAFRVRAPQLDVRARNSTVGSGYWLDLEVDDFQAEYATDDAPPVAHVRVTARLGNASDHRVIARLDLDTRQAAAENRVSAIVAAYNLALNDTLGRLVTETAATLPVGSVATR